MKGLKRILLAEQVRLERIIKGAKKRLANSPEGRLRISRSHNCVQYYHCTSEKKSGSYIGKDKIELAKKLAQKAYDKNILKLAEKRVEQIKEFVADYADDELEQLYLGENLERQKLIRPVEPTWEQRLEEWKKQAYEGKGFQEGTPIIMTEKGERVRSKSEKIIADYLYRHGIEYKYECPIQLKEMSVVYPDFTFLSPKTGKEIYWEHCGRVDDPKYARKMVRKINAYENSGIFVGERLILTYETEQTILSTTKIEQMVKRYLVE